MLKINILYGITRTFILISIVALNLSLLHLNRHVSLVKTWFFGALNEVRGLDREKESDLVISQGLQMSPLRNTFNTRQVWEIVMQLKDKKVAGFDRTTKHLKLRSLIA